MAALAAPGVDTPAAFTQGVSKSCAAIVPSSLTPRAKRKGKVVEEEKEGP